MATGSETSVRAHNPDKVRYDDVRGIVKKIVEKAGHLHSFFAHSPHMVMAGIILLNLFDTYGQLSPNEKKKFGELKNTK